MHCIKQMWKKQLTTKHKSKTITVLRPIVTSYEGGEFYLKQFDYQNFEIFHCSEDKAAGFECYPWSEKQCLLKFSTDGSFIKDVTQFWTIFESFFPS